MVKHPDGLDPLFDIVQEACTRQASPPTDQKRQGDPFGFGMTFPKSYKTRLKSAIHSQKHISDNPNYDDRDGGR